MGVLKTLAFLSFLLICFVFAALAVNQQQVGLTFLGYSTPFTLSIFWWLLAALLLGILVGWLYTIFAHLPLRLRHRKANKQLAAAEAKVVELQKQISASAGHESEPKP